MRRRDAAGPGWTGSGEDSAAARAERLTVAAALVPNSALSVNNIDGFGILDVFTGYHFSIGLSIK